MTSHSPLVTHSLKRFQDSVITHRLRGAMSPGKDPLTISANEVKNLKNSNACEGRVQAKLLVALLAS